MKLLNKNKFSVASVANKGVTLTELLVAVAITVGMLAMTGLVFKSTSEAAGKAQANNLIMQDLRSLTYQIDQDFSGFQPDMPFAVVWEAHINDSTLDANPQLGDPDDPTRWVRYDRIVFFANGDFQAPDGPGSTGYLSANLARIFYGQSADNPLTPPETQLYEPPRQFLARRFKLLTANTATGWNQSLMGAYVQIPSDGLSWAGWGALPDTYDYTPIENATLAFWKNESQFNFLNCYFTSQPLLAAGNASFVRRPVINNLNDDGKQRIYMLDDVTDFKIELWFPGATEWFPNERDCFNINSAGYILPFYIYSPGVPRQFAFYWNAPYHTSNALLGEPLDGGTMYQTNWRAEQDITTIRTDPLLTPLLGWSGAWPEAIKFTFTLYDKHRRHFPKGQTFSYIVQLPPRP